MNKEYILYLKKQMGKAAYQSPHPNHTKVGALGFFFFDKWSFGIKTQLSCMCLSHHLHRR